MGTEINVVSDVNVTGLLAQMGRGLIQDVSDQMFQVFTERMRAALATGRATGEGGGVSSVTAGERTKRGEALDVGALGAAAGKRAAGRMLARRGFWFGVAALLIVIYWVFVR